MSSLWQSLRRPQLWCAILFMFIAGAAADAARKPSNQFGAVVYVRLVRFYQAACSPYLANCVRCRYAPTCSEYSIRAVQEFGLLKGLRMTLSRILRCRESVPLGTHDPPPFRSLGT